jgi:hypothetical protein
VGGASFPERRSGSSPLVCLKLAHPPRGLREVALLAEAVGSGCALG